MRLRRSATINTDGTGLDGSILGLKSPCGGSGGVGGGFFVRKDEWKRLHLPESIRASILERSASPTKEMNSLNERNIDADYPYLEDENSVRNDQHTVVTNDDQHPATVPANVSTPSKGAANNPITSKALVSVSL